MLRRILVMFLVFVVMLSLPFYAFAENKNQGTQNELYDKLDDLVAIANNFVQRRTEALTNTEGAGSASILSIGDVKESYQLWVSESLALQELTARRSILSDWGEAYTHSETEITLLDFEVHGNKAELGFKEYSKLYYERIYGFEPDCTAWVSLRHFVFEKKA